MPDLDYEPGPFSPVDPGDLLGPRGDQVFVGLYAELIGQVAGADVAVQSCLTAIAGVDAAGVDAALGTAIDQVAADVANEDATPAPGFVDETEHASGVREGAERTREQLPDEQQPPPKIMIPRRAGTPVELNTNVAKAVPRSEWKPQIPAGSVPQSGKLPPDFAELIELWKHPPEAQQ